MSDNYRLYTSKMAEQRAARSVSRTLCLQLIELLQFALECEANWH